MPFARDHNRILIGVAAMLATAALAFYGTGLQPLWPLLWIAPVPVLFAAPRLSAAAAFSFAALAWFLSGFNMWRYAMNILGRPGPRSIATAIVLLSIPAIFFGLAVLLARRFLLRRRGVAAAIAFPAAWVTYEYVLTVASPHSTFGNIAYTQMNFLPIVQMAALTGVAGVSFSVFFFAATIAALLHGPSRAMLAIGAAVFFAAIFAFGLWRLRSTPVAPSVKVGLIASDVAANVFPQEPGRDSKRLLEDYLRHAAPLVKRGAQVIVAPEKLAVMIDADKRDGDAPMAAFAREQKSDVVVGWIRIAPPARFNEARMYTGDEVLTYDKRHMLPAFESKFTPGRTSLLIPKPSGTWGLAICKDMDFPALGRDYGRRGAGLLLVPAWDFVDDGWLHDRMAVMRGVESGFTIARAAKQGLLTVTDSRGRVLAQQSSGAAPFATLLADAPVYHEGTPYARFGDWFAWLTIAALVSLAVIIPARERLRDAVASHAAASDPDAKESRLS